MSPGDWVAIGLGLPTVLVGFLALRVSLTSEAERQRNRLQDRIWQLEDELRRREDDDDH